MCCLASGRKVSRETAVILSLGYSIRLVWRVNFFLMQPMISRDIRIYLTILLTYSVVIFYLFRSGFHAFY